MAPPDGEVGPKVDELLGAGVAWPHGEIRAYREVRAEMAAAHPLGGRSDRPP
jgi:hypothetical protein